MNETVSAFGIRIDALDMFQAVNRIIGWIESPGQQACRYVVTPNVDHIIRLQENRKFQAAYHDAALVLTDGKPVFFSLALLGKAIPETVPGSDLVPRLFDAFDSRRSRVRIFLLGAAPGVAEKAASAIKGNWSYVDVVGVHSPPFGFETDGQENERILGKITAARPDLLVIGLGAPKQELWVHEHYQDIDASVALCVGSTIDFFAGEQHRAPKWMRKLALEWLHRAIKDPKRLGKRYAVNLLFFPGILWREWRSGGSS